MSKLLSELLSDPILSLLEPAPSRCDAPVISQQTKGVKPKQVDGILQLSQLHLFE